MKKIIVANWKMKPTSLKEAKTIFNGIKKTVTSLKKTNIIICPPFVYLSELGHSVSKLLGSQDVFWSEKGSHTGEISVEMLQDLGVKYIIVGHSEKRAIGETDEIINKKIKLALKYRFKVIFCVGERERDSRGRYLYFVKHQIESGLKGISRQFLKNVVIAYEPVWAIGKKGAEADTPEDVLQMTIFIRKSLLKITGKKMAHDTPILYGGSVSPQNAGAFLQHGGVQGLLVGHESLVPKHFNEILKISEIN